MESLYALHIKGIFYAKHLKFTNYRIRSDWRKIFSLTIKTIFHIIRLCMYDRHCYGNCCTPLSAVAQQRLIAFCLAGYFVYGSDFFSSRIALCCSGPCSCLTTLSKMRRLIYCLEICTSPYLNTQTAYFSNVAQRILAAGFSGLLVV